MDQVGPAARESTFEISQETVSRRFGAVKLILAVGLCLLFLAQLSTDDSLATKLGVIVGTAAAAGLGFYVARAAVGKMFDLRLSLSALGIERIGAGHAETILWGEVEKVSIVGNRDPEKIRIQVSSPRRTFALSAFRGMAALEQAIRANVDSQKIQSSDGQKTLAYSAAAGVGLAALMIALSRMGYAGLAESVIPVAAGLFFLFGKPAAKTFGAKFRKIEVVLGCLLVIMPLLTTPNVFEGKGVFRGPWIRTSGFPFANSFSVYLPTEPEVRSERGLATDLPGVTFDTDVFTSRDGGATFTVIRYVYSEPLLVDAASGEEILLAQLESLRANLPGFVLASSEFDAQTSVAAIRPLNFKLTSVRPVENLRGRLILLHDEAVYMLLMAYAPYDRADEDYAKFVDSFSIHVSD